MAQLILSRPRLGRTGFALNQHLLGRVDPIENTDTAKWFIRYTFYAFVFSLPFEELDIGMEATLPKLFGVALAAFALLQPKLCYKSPPKAFWWFVVYLGIYILWGSYLILTPPNIPTFPRSFIGSVLRLVQLFFLFWIAYNLLQQERIAKGTLWALAGATIILAILQIVGITSDVSKTGRVSAFDANPNGLATILSLGLLALFGLAYGRLKNEWKGRLLFWFGSGIVAIALVQTGSRGAVLALAATMSIFFLKGKNLATKLKFGVIALVGIVVLVVASYHVDAVRKRWEHTFYEQSLAGRQRIFPEAVGMILESPIVGWGPLVHLWELGPRLGVPMRDEHNVYLWVLAETGIVGAIPFFVGLWVCGRCAWRSRHSVQGFLPFVMLLFVLLLSMKGTIHHRKYYWVVLSYALASSSYLARTQRARTPVSRQPDSSVAQRRYKLVKVPTKRLPPRVSRLS